MARRGESALVSAELARAHNNLGALNKALGRAQAAETSLHAAETLLKELQAKEPEVPAHRQDLAITYASLSHLLCDTDAKKADAYYRESIALREQLSKDF